MTAQRRLTRAALLLSIMLLAQSLRLVLPLPPFISMFVIGSVVNACLLLTVEYSGWKAALVLAFVAPLAAYFQQMLPLPVLMLPVAAANAGYVFGYATKRLWGRWGALVLATLAKAALLYLTATILTGWLELPPKIVSLLSLMFGWPQLITGLGGGILCFIIRKRIK